MPYAPERTKSFRSYAIEVLAKSDRLSPQNMALLVSCMDYRYPHRIVDVMNELDLSGKYDHFVLAGAARGARVPCWGDGPGGGGGALAGVQGANGCAFDERNLLLRRWNFLGFASDAGDRHARP